MKKGVILVSGGADSATVLSIMQQQNYEIYALSFNYMQRHAIEISKIKEFIKDYNVKEHKIANIDLSVFGGSALTDKNINMPNYDSANDIDDEIPVSYVPARNTIFLSYALGYAEIIGARDIFLGVHMSDGPNYPDCRPEYINAYEKLANLATKQGVEGKDKFNIVAPLIDLKKHEIIALGLKNNVDYSKTISCYDPSEDGASCGKCLACVSRIDAFKANNVKDNIKYNL